MEEHLVNVVAHHGETSIEAHRSRLPVDGEVSSGDDIVVVHGISEDRADISDHVS